MDGLLLQQKHQQKQFYMFYFRFRNPVSGKEMVMLSSGHQTLTFSHPSGGLEDLFSAAALLHCDHHKYVTLSLFLVLINRKYFARKCSCLLSYINTEVLLSMHQDIPALLSPRSLSSFFSLQIFLFCDTHCSNIFVVSSCAKKLATLAVC